jgi:replicative DNA helicase
MNEPRSLPFSEDAEKGVLCSMILSPEVLLECASRIAAEFFHVPAHRIIFSALCDLAAENEPADFVLLKAELVRSKQLEEIGGAEYLSDLWNFVPTGANWKFYASLLVEFYRRRTTIIECQRLIEKMYDLHGDIDEQITEGVETALTRLALQVARVDKPFRQLVAETVAEIDRRAKGEGSTGIRFGLDSLDAQLGEVQPGEVCVISAQTGGGKTALALQAILEHAASGYSVALFSFEMRATQMIERALAHDGQISMKTIRSGKLSMSELGKLDASVGRLSERAIFIMENTGCDINQIVSRCRYLKVRYALTLVVVDYLQLVQPGASRNDATREREVADISRKLKAMALELNVPVLALSQLNDQGRLRESRAIGQDADIVLRIDDSKSDNSFAVDIVIDKHRSGARGKRVNVEFFGEYMRFQDLETLR